MAVVLQYLDYILNAFEVPYLEISSKLKFFSQYRELKLKETISTKFSFSNSTDILTQQQSRVGFFRPYQLSPFKPSPLNKHLVRFYIADVKCFSIIIVKVRVILHLIKYILTRTVETDQKDNDITTSNNLFSPFTNVSQPIRKLTSEK